MKDEFYNLGMIDENYIIKAKLGKGASSIVYKIQDWKTKEEFAAKVIDSYNKNEFQNNQKLSRINNSHIIKFISFKQGNIILSNTKDFKPYFIFELSDKGDLSDYINCGKNGFKELHCKFIFHEILEGIQAIHNEKIYHGDIKAENILLSSDKYIIKICDFGLSADSEELQNGRRGTEQYMAPEIIMEKDEYDGIKADIFSLGVLLCLLRVGKNLFDQAKITNNNMQQTKYDYIKEKNETFWKICEANAINGLTKEFKDLYLKMVAYEPKERPSIEEIINGEWIKEIKDLNEKEYENLRKEIIKEFRQREEIILSNKDL